MKINRIPTYLAIAPQIIKHDIDAIKTAGFKSIICNRPDGEDQDQPNHSELEVAAEHAGMQFRYQPVINTDVSSEDVAQFENYLKSLRGPILAYCRTGTRSTILWSLSQVNYRSISGILQLTQAAGYDISGLIR